MLSPLEFNHKRVAEKEIEPILKSLEEVCIKYHLPFNVCVCVANKKIDENTYAPEYIRKGRTPASFEFIIPTDDEISDHYSISCGAKALITTPGDYNFDDLAIGDSTEYT